MTKEKLYSVIETYLEGTEITATETLINGLVTAILTDPLLDDVKNYLGITWEDESTNKKIAGIIERGMKYLDAVSGTSNDYTQEDKPRELLFDYCLYVRSNKLSEFQNNYLSELLTLQMRQEVTDYAAENPVV